MQSSITLLAVIKNAIITTHDLNAFIQFSDSISGDTTVDFEKDILVGAGYDERVYNYLKALHTKGKVLLFCDAYLKRLLPAQIAFFEVVALKGKLEKLYVEENGKWRIAPNHFDCPAFQRTNLVFLDRTPVRDAFRNMINDDENPVILIKGEERAGLSYIKYYLNYFETKFENFKLVDIDFKKEVAGYADGSLIYAAHFAQVLSDRIGMDYTVDLTKPDVFKVIPFLNKVKAFLDKSSDLYLFFLDQFNVPMADDVYSMITGLAELTIKKYRVLFIISGYNKTDDWDFALDHMSKKIDIATGHITKDHTNIFFDRVYKEISTEFHGISFTKEEFFTEVSKLLNDADFATEHTNVGIIGPRLSIWYKSLNEKLKGYAVNN